MKPCKLVPKYTIVQRVAHFLVFALMRTYIWSLKEPLRYKYLRDDFIDDAAIHVIKVIYKDEEWSASGWEKLLSVAFLRLCIASAGCT